jgi:hypothetical protein
MPLEMALGRNIVLMAMIALLWNRLEKSPTLALS